jgi:hypothetical protein
VRFGNVSAPNGSLSIVRFSERGKRGATNGFGIGYRRLPLATVVQERLRTGRDVVGRLAAIARDERTMQAATEAGRLARPYAEHVDITAYRAHLTARSAIVRAAAAKQLAQGGGDPFNVDAAFAALGRALASGNDEAVAIADDVALARLDAHLTWMQRRSRKVP